MSPLLPFWVEATVPLTDHTTVISLSSDDVTVKLKGQGSPFLTVVVLTGSVRVITEPTTPPPPPVAGR